MTRFLARCASESWAQTSILDVDAFYAVHAQLLAENMTDRFLDGTKVLIPLHGFKAESLPSLISSMTSCVIIDDLNSLVSLASAKSQSHQLFAFMKMLSYHSRINESWAFATAYRGEWNQQKPNRRSLESLGDVVIEAKLEGGSVTFESKGTGWPDGELSLGAHLET